jgi:hypothetical protein
LTSGSTAQGRVNYRNFPGCGTRSAFHGRPRNVEDRSPELKNERTNQQVHQVTNHHRAAVDAAEGDGEYRRPDPLWRAFVDQHASGVGWRSDRLTVGASNAPKKLGLPSCMTPQISSYTHIPPRSTALTLVPSTPIEQFGEAIADLTARIHAATHELLVMLREFDATNGWTNGSPGEHAVLELADGGIHVSAIESVPRARTRRRDAVIPSDSDLRMDIQSEAPPAGRL